MNLALTYVAFRNSCWCYFRLVVRFDPSFCSRHTVLSSFRHPVLAQPQVTRGSLCALSVLQRLPVGRRPSVRHWQWDELCYQSQRLHWARNRDLENPQGHKRYGKNTKIKPIFFSLSDSSHNWLSFVYSQKNLFRAVNACIKRIISWSTLCMYWSLDAFITSFRQINRENKLFGIFPRIWFEDKSTYTESHTREYDVVWNVYIWRHCRPCDEFWQICRWAFMSLSNRYIDFDVYDSTTVWVFCFSVGSLPSSTCLGCCFHCSAAMRFIRSSTSSTRAGTLGCWTWCMAFFSRLVRTWRFLLLPFPAVSSVDFNVFAEPGTFEH